MTAYEIHVDASICKGCDLCVFHCPRGVLALSDQPNAKGYNVVQAKQPQSCIGCRLCEYNCPDLAIHVESVEIQATVGR